MTVASCISKCVYPVTHGTTKVPPALIGGGSGPAPDPLDTILPEQLLLKDGASAHYSTGEWSGGEHLLADRRPGVGSLRVPRAGRAWLFDGTDDYGISSGDSGLTGNVTCTFCAWIKVYTLNDYMSIVGTGNFGFALSGVSLVLMASGALGLSFAGVNDAHSSSGQISTGIWVHIAAVKSPGAINSTTTLYLNGVSVAVSGGSTDTPNTGVGKLCCGALPMGTAVTSPHFSGSMRDVRVYSVSKSASEIAAIYNQASTPGTYDTTGLLGAWWCNEESGTTGYDWSGNGKHLTLTNITQATFHASDSGVTYNDANVRGYRLSGAVYIPAINSTTAADGNALTQTGKAPQVGYAPQKILTTSGTEYISIPSLTGAETVTSSVGTSTVSVSPGQINFTSGTASMVVLSNGFTFPLCEGPGTSNTNRTVYGMKSDGSVVAGTIVNGTVSTMWAAETSVASTVPNWFLKYGGTLNGSGVLVPAKLDGSTDAAGNAIGIPAAKFGAGTLNAMPYSNPLGVALGLETAITPTTDRKTASTSKRRRRVVSSLVDRLGARSTAMSDATSNTYFGD